MDRVGCIMSTWLTDTCLIGLDVFMINNSSSTNDRYQVHVIDFDLPVIEDIDRFVGGLHSFAVYRGCVRLHFMKITDPKLFVWELKEQELQKTAVDRTRKLGLEDMRRYSLDRSSR